MPFDHNDHYHPLLLRSVPPDARRALDVGCGTGAFARALARRGLEVDAVDRDESVLAAARASGGPAPIRYRQADLTALQLTPGHYDFISCLASLHHLPLDTLARLREALAPGGVLVVLGCYRETTPGDRLISLTAVPVNALCRLAVHLRERGAPPSRVRAPVTMPQTSLPEIRAYAERHLPGFRVRRLLFWRYLLAYRRPW
ncbi:class I SAM-dependent methyltransferase [Kitasatospora aureofaciens]|uniref:Methyltransferase n=1 Tax=Kitasatospora aureofaciens TaxID=1894 RepID=A0A1E7N7L9_KITAU|nr:class I SAM-dependent methyltransferase [Kitasatospora aureofaciens]QEV02948.1 class I SAM-dependent methyltransferase [Streptomyces viridifaciens]ARF81496.1 SAM-dependent methyltransferase [Kitasatospora aureofaciens]OEV36668.1 methyltransferase [Kitasatospora aureofaciens]UKZ09574.1 class I SAM-dependent methyltransferase [Streptomyces viridifaciens]GGU57819.1 methyltransferase [Kitasatospora aureofaciens]